MPQIIVPELSKLELTAKTMAAIFNALSELPYKLAQPALAEIEAQLLKQQPAPPGKPPGEPARPPKGAKSNVQPIQPDQRRDNGDRSGSQGQAAGGN
jgi:hypothetical protein